MSEARGRLLRPAPEHEVEPQGWLLDQLRADLRDGVVGHLDQLAPDLVVDDQIFGRDRLRPGAAPKDLGAASDDDAWVVQFQWWNAETQGNWRDGWIHHALWAGSQQDHAKVAGWVAQILETQDDDGYLGIHTPELRYPQHGENGELWGQATLLRALLGYHRHTREPRVLEAVERAVARTMAGYPPGVSEPFGRDASFGGVTHGLMISDVLWDLAAAVGGDRASTYEAYAAWLYASFARSTTATGDARAEDLCDAGLGFRGHGVHTYEHWRALTVAAAVAADRGGGPHALAGAVDPDLDLRALEAAYETKLAAALTPAGAPNGDELCHAHGSAHDTGYELCSVTELLHGYGRRVETTADLSLGDRMESLLFNVGFGMRDPLGTGVAYLKTDNSRSMTGPEGFRPPAGGVPQTRYRYSPLHREAAVCCVPNWGRLLPLYLRHQWLLGRSEDGPELTLLLFGPSVLRTTIDGTPVAIHQSTTYPGETACELAVETAAPLVMTLVIRVPGWAAGVHVRGVDPGRVRFADGRVRIAGTWSGRHAVEIRFDAPPEVRRGSGGERMVARGPLLFALPLPGDRSETHHHPVHGTQARFADVRIRPTGSPPAPTLVDGQIRPADPPAGSEATAAPHAWQRQAVSVPVADADGAVAERLFVPMGATALRLVAFDQASEASVRRR